jgi:hypothetical protein
MTPLAHQIIKDAARGALMSDDERNLAAKFEKEVHCFECSNVHELASEMAWDLVSGKSKFDCGDTFLPAPRTWVEARIDGARKAWLLEEFGKEIVVSTAQESLSYESSLGLPANKLAIEWWVLNEVLKIPRLSVGKSPVKKVVCDEDIDRALRDATGDHGAIIDDHERALLCVMLSLINTPKVVGRRQHMAHRGLQKALLRRRKEIGVFPLRAWTEIILQISPPQDASSQPSVEARLTGDKALHFCRAHLRVRFGRLELVKSHWRGDASLGIKRSRYRVEQGRAA